MYQGSVKFIYKSKEIIPTYSSTFPELIPDETVTVQSDCYDLNIHQYFELFKKFVSALGFDEKNIVKGACHLAFNESNKEDVMREIAEEYDLIMSEDLPGIMEDRLKQEKEWLEQNKPEPDVWEKRYWQLYNRFCKFARFTDDELDQMVKDTMPPWGHSDMEALKYTDAEMNAMCDKAASDEEKRKCQEYNLREAEYYNNDKVASNSMTWDQAIADGWEMTADGFWIKESKKPLNPWNGLIPGSSEARDAGCLCPVMDNEEMPVDKKWVDVECPIHGRKKND